jgi:hypothetical protein
MRSQRDIFGGLIFLAFGITAAIIAYGYPLGSAARMGPGYFPFVLGCVLSLLGLAVIVRGLLSNGPPVERADWRALVLVLLAIAAFAAGVETLGLAIATALLIAIGSAASPESRPREAALLVVVMVVFTLGVFIYTLKLPFKAWPG